MSCILSDGKQAGVEQLQWCRKYGFSCMEMSGKQNFPLTCEISHDVLT